MTSSKEIILRLPFPITANHFYQRHGHFTFIPKKGLEHIEAVKKAVKEQLPNHITETRPLKVTIKCYQANYRRRDIDNLCKVCNDCMQKAGVYKNDAQIKDLRIFMSPNIRPNNPHVTVKIQVIEWPPLPQVPVPVPVPSPVPVPVHVPSEAPVSES